MTDEATPKTRNERWDELKRISAMQNGINRLHLIIRTTGIPFERLPIKALIDAILEHEYPQGKSAAST